MDNNFVIFDETQALISKTVLNLNAILKEVFHHTNQKKAVLVYDIESTLSNILATAYKYCLPDGIFVDFNKHAPQEILEILSSLHPSDLVILVQSTHFRLDAFRLRVELFKRKIKVIEHPHLSRMAESQIPYYIDSLAYDTHYYHTIGYGLKQKIESASSAILKSDGEILVYSSPFESVKLNIGDYSLMPNMGGQFPLGEVFSELKDLTALNGRVQIFAFGDISYRVNYPKRPITLIVQKGQIIGCENSTPQFDEILSKILEDEGVVWIRELGLGLNRAFTKTHIVNDIGAYERMCGIHFSLGAKHGIYAKPGFKRSDGKYHIDVFANTDTFIVDDEIIYKDDRWIIS